MRESKHRLALWVCVFWTTGAIAQTPALSETDAVDIGTRYIQKQAPSYNCRAIHREQPTVNAAGVSVPMEKEDAVARVNFILVCAPSLTAGTRGNPVLVYVNKASREPTVAGVGVR